MDSNLFYRHMIKISNTFFKNYTLSFCFEAFQEFLKIKLESRFFLEGTVGNYDEVIQDILGGGWMIDAEIKCILH